MKSYEELLIKRWKRKYKKTRNKYDAGKKQYYNLKNEHDQLVSVFTDCGIPFGFKKTLELLEKVKAMDSEFLIRNADDFFKRMDKSQ